MACTYSKIINKILEIAAGVHQEEKCEYINIYIYIYIYKEEKEMIEIEWMSE